MVHLQVRVRKSNDSKQTKQTSNKMYTKSSKILNKRGIKPYLLIAWTLLDKTPFFPEDQTPLPPSQATNRKPTLNYINIEFDDWD